MLEWLKNQAASFFWCLLMLCTNCLVWFLCWKYSEMCSGQAFQFAQTSPYHCSVIEHRGDINDEGIPFNGILFFFHCNSGSMQSYEKQCHWGGRWGSQLTSKYLNPFLVGKLNWSFKLCIINKLPHLCICIASNTSWLLHIIMLKGCCVLQSVYYGNSIIAIWFQYDGIWHIV